MNGHKFVVKTKQVVISSGTNLRHGIKAMINIIIHGCHNKFCNDTCNQT